MEGGNVTKLYLSHIMKKHSGKKAYLCTECDKPFIQEADLKRHLLTHRGKKEHKCDECGKSFVQSAHLNRHLLIYTGKKYTNAIHVVNHSHKRRVYMAIQKYIQARKRTTYMNVKHVTSPLLDQIV